MILFYLKMLIIKVKDTLIQIQQIQNLHRKLNSLNYNNLMRISKNEDSPTQHYASLSPQQRQCYVESFQASNHQFVNFAKDCQYPEKDFISLQGIQNDRIIKLMTFRYPSQLDPVKGVFVIFNSFYMHSKYTSHLAKRLSQQGYTVVTFDNRGHGLSQGEQGQWQDYNGIIKQSYQFLKKIEKMYANLPMFLLGWGIAALNVLYISLYHYKEFKFAGIILSSTLFKIPIYSKTCRVIGSVAVKALSIMPIKIGIYKPKYSFFTRYNNINKMLQDDKLNTHEMISAKTVLQVNQLIDDLPQNLWNKIDTPPIVVLHGQCDKHGNGYHAYQFFNQIKSKDKQLWYYQKMNFAWLLEDQYPEIQNRLVAWLDKHAQ